jgi:hypothetical protein
MKNKRLDEARRAVADAEAFAQRPGVDANCANAALSSARQKLFHLERMAARRAAQEAGAAFFSTGGMARPVE